MKGGEIMKEWSIPTISNLSIEKTASCDYGKKTFGNGNDKYINDGLEKWLESWTPGTKTPS